MPLTQKISQTTPAPRFWIHISTVPGAKQTFTKSVSNVLHYKHMGKDVSQIAKPVVTILVLLFTLALKPFGKDDVHVQIITLHPGLYEYSLSVDLR